MRVTGLIEMGHSFTVGRTECHRHQCKPPLLDKPAVAPGTRIPCTTEIGPIRKGSENTAGPARSGPRRIRKRIEQATR